MKTNHSMNWNAAGVVDRTSRWREESKRVCTSERKRPSTWTWDFHTFNIPTHSSHCPVYCVQLKQQHTKCLLLTSQEASDKSLIWVDLVDIDGCTLQIHEQCTCLVSLDSRAGYHVLAAPFSFLAHHNCSWRHQLHRVGAFSLHWLPLL